jgi:polyhydroxyalkanoate synthesis regulator phasin
MDQKKVAKQMMDFNKTAFDNTFNSMTVLQDQTEKLVFSFLEKAPWFPEDGKKAVNEWIKAYKKGREDFKSAADESYKKVNDYFAKAEKEETTKTGKK